ncbi:hypothetical protein L484_011878 [Morus notabilis]|uniref:Uncharacterized protein n=1 Tax=Morus notabilis TaxID=981085 RepID=W9S219_9ROSA|nr:hypothetical protein L484_011878 [Morus notabilis]
MGIGSLLPYNGTAGYGWVGLDGMDWTGPRSGIEEGQVHQAWRSLFLGRLERANSEWRNWRKPLCTSIRAISYDMEVLALCTKGFSIMGLWFSKGEQARLDRNLLHRVFYDNIILRWVMYMARGVKIDMGSSENIKIKGSDTIELLKLRIEESLDKRTELNNLNGLPPTQDGAGLKRGNQSGGKGTKRSGCLCFGP